MVVKLVLREKAFEVMPGMSLSRSLAMAGVPFESVLAIRDGNLLTGDEILHEGEQIKLVAVISGG